RIDMFDCRKIDRTDRTLHRFQTGGQVMQAGNGQRPGKPQHRITVARFFYKVGGFHHWVRLLVHYRLHGKAKRPIRQTERRAAEKVSDTA
ncbi:MAG: hypothetical protein PSY12_08260, partial [bacterium]|nr:hypothetical protein [bacterium]